MIKRLLFMKNLLKQYDIKVGNATKTVFNNDNDIYQDGTLPLYRDKDGTLWAISGHTHAGHIGMFKGTCLSDLVEVYPTKMNFETGSADNAFNGIKYPEGIKSRGSVWPMGLYICPNTHRFFCFFHNETGWNGKGTGYDAYGLCDKPNGDSDFRHIGLMVSDDEGKTWDFLRWVLTSEQVCFTKAYNPDGINVLGQENKSLSLGSGDFTLFVNERDGFMYLVYNILSFDFDEKRLSGCNVYLARTRIRNDGIMGDFVKFYDGSFSEPGNFGKETPIVENAWHARITYSENLGAYVMSSTAVNSSAYEVSEFVPDYAEFRTGKTLTEWSEPITIPYKEGNCGYFGNHYVSLVSEDNVSSASELRGGVSALLCHNATDVMKYPLKFCKKRSKLFF